jgi:hypothetical protein
LKQYRALSAASSLSRHGEHSTRGTRAQAFRRQKLQARIVLAAMELRVARLQERLRAVQALKRRLDGCCAGGPAAAATWAPQTEG